MGRLKKKTFPQTNHFPYPSSNFNIDRSKYLRRRGCTGDTPPPVFSQNVSMVVDISTPGCVSSFVCVRACDCVWVTRRILAIFNFLWVALNVCCAIPFPPVVRNRSTISQNATLFHLQYSLRVLTSIKFSFQLRTYLPWGLIQKNSSGSLSQNSDSFNKNFHFHHIPSRKFSWNTYRDVHEIF